MIKFQYYDMLPNENGSLSLFSIYTEKKLIKKVKFYF